MTPFKLQKRGFCNLPSVSCIAIGPPVKDDENTGGPKESDPGVCTLPIILQPEWELLLRAKGLVE